MFAGEGRSPPTPTAKYLTNITYPSTSCIGYFRNTDDKMFLMRGLEQKVAESAFRLGFALVGFAPIHRLTERENFFREWLAEGRAGEMGWLGRQPERRFDPRILDGRLGSVVSLAYPYPAPRPPL